jgi:porphobilinogen synthase
MSYPDIRPRRLRRTAALRRLVEETRVSPAELVLPLFVKEGLREPRPISSLPGVVQHSRDSLRKAAHEAVRAGVGGLMLFGVPDNASKDETGSAGLDPDGILNVAIRDVIEEVGDATVVMSDLCLDEFTSHGHCGVLAPDGSVDNDATLELYAQMGVAQAEAGAHVLGPSGMMDGQVGVIRKALDRAGFQTPRSWRTPPSTPAPSTARSARPWNRRSRATGGSTSRAPATFARRCARWTWTSPRVPTW